MLRMGREQLGWQSGATGLGTESGAASNTSAKSVARWSIRYRWTSRYGFLAARFLAARFFAAFFAPVFLVAFLAARFFAAFFAPVFLVAFLAARFFAAFFFVGTSTIFLPKHSLKGSSVFGSSAPIR